MPRFFSLLAAVMFTCATAAPALAGQSAPEQTTAPSAQTQTQTQTPPKPLPPAQTPVPAAPPAQQQPAAQPPPTYQDTTVVSASKTEQQLLDAPATMTVLGQQALETAPSSNYADLMRSVPGVNVTQISARDINITSRAASSSLATSELAVVDGRSLYQDFFGFTMWDFMPMNLDEIKQIEVIRGPASVVWGANALNGVVNVITKSPREMAGTIVTFGLGDFSRSVNDNGASQGSLYYANVMHAAPINDRWAYKVSVGGYWQDALARPTGLIPNGTGTMYPAFANSGTEQPKFDFRADYDSPDKVQAMSLSGGVSATSGMMESGLGPFSINPGATMSYGKFSYTRKAFKYQSFVNALDGDASNLVSLGPTGVPVALSFKTQTIDNEVGDSMVIGTHQVVTYGGNFRFNHFNLTVAPSQTHRTEGGGYVQDEVLLTDHLRLVAGGRVDKFSSISAPAFSPRVAFVIEPNKNQTVRVSYNRAFRAPSMINDNLNVTITTPIPLNIFSPAFGSSVFLVPTTAMGDPALKAEELDAYEVSYTAVVAKRTTLSAAGYYNHLENEILFTQTANWPASTPPPGWPAGPIAWAGLIASEALPQAYSYANLGTEINKGIELGADTSISRTFNVYGNYSFQAQPEPNFPGFTAAAALAEVNLPAKNRFNVGAGFTNKQWLASLSASYSQKAFWQDVLDARYHGFTNAFTMVNASLGTKWDSGRYQATVKVTNLLNQQIQEHIFGDVFKRQVIGELTVRLPNWQRVKARKVKG